MTNYVAITFDTQAPYLHVEAIAARWQITRMATAGITLGIMWGPLRRPWAFPRVDRMQPTYLRFPNPWLERADFILRIPWVILPWFHVWWWRGPAEALMIHPARFYIGGKLFFAHDNSPFPDGTPSPRANEDIWRDPKKDPPGWYVTPSVSLRRGGATTTN